VFQFAWRVCRFIRSVVVLYRSRRSEQRGPALREQSDGIR